MPLKAITPLGVEKCPALVIGHNVNDIKIARDLGVTPGTHKPAPSTLLYDDYTPFNKIGNIICCHSNAYNAKYVCSVENNKRDITSEGILVFKNRKGKHTTAAVKKQRSKNVIFIDDERCPAIDTGMFAIWWALYYGHNPVYTVGIDYIGINKDISTVKKLIRENKYKEEDLIRYRSNVPRVCIEVMEKIKQQFPDGKVYKLHKISQLPVPVLDIMKTLTKRDINIKTQHKRDINMKTKYTYVTWTNRVSDLQGIIALRNSMLKHKSKYSLLVLYTNIDEKNLSIINHESINCKEVSPIYSKKQRRKHFYTKLRAFELTEFDKIIFIDTDIILLKNIDHLFHKDLGRYNVAFAPDHGIKMNHNRFNTGLFVYTPSKALFDDLMLKKDILPTYDGTDQGFLNTYFGDNYYKLNMKYNVLKRIFKHHRKIWDDIQNDIHVLHFVGRKPWITQDKGYEALDKIWNIYK